MWRIRLFIENIRCRRDVQKFESKLQDLTNEEDVEDLESLIELRKALMSKDFYMFVNRKEINKYK